jgi:squalene monooxygenase
MRTACLEYFKLGGNNVLVPMSLLSGMCTSSRILLYHFFRVALYGAWRTLKPFPTPKKLIFCYRLLGSASWIVIPLMKGEKVFGFFSNFLTFLFYLVSPKQQIPSKK